MAKYEKKYLGVDKFGLDYYLYTDGYVYQFSGSICYGWYCSFPAWERTMHRCIIKPWQRTLKNQKGGEKE